MKRLVYLILALSIFTASCGHYTVKQMGAHSGSKKHRKPVR